MIDPRMRFGHDTFSPGAGLCQSRRPDSAVSNVPLGALTQVCMAQVDPFRLFHELVSRREDDEHWDVEVVHEECLDGERGHWACVSDSSASSAAH